MPDKINQTWKEKVPLGLSYMSNLKKKVKYKKELLLKACPGGIKHCQSKNT